MRRQRSPHPHQHRPVASRCLCRSPASRVFTTRVSVRPGLGLRPGIGIGGCGIGSCGIGIGSCGIGSCGAGIGSCGIGLGGCGLGDPVFVGGSPWWGLSSSSICNSGCATTLPTVVYVNSLGLCSSFPGGPFLDGGRFGLGFRGLGLRNSLGLGLR